jgi:uncharacterized cupin superfamily protein
MAERRHPHVVNLSEVNAVKIEGGKRFEASDKRLTDVVGARGVGCSYYEVAPGKCAFPFHYHCANEESVFILEGEGTARIGDARVPVRAGDYIAFRPGPENAHQIENTGASTLKYLCMSTLIPVDVVGYPDSKKHAATAAPSVEAAVAGKRWMRHIWKDGPSAEYYEGEDA